MLIPRNRRKPANMSRSLSLCLSSPTACSFCLLAFTDDRPASSPGVTWHAVVVRFSASAGDVNLFCLWLSFAAGCLSLFFEQIRSDGFHNRISAAVTPQRAHKWHLRGVHIGARVCAALDEEIELIRQKRARLLHRGSVMSLMFPTVDRAIVRPFFIFNSHQFGIGIERLPPS